eukprot:UC4_evm4s1221
MASPSPVSARNLHLLGKEGAIKLAISEIALFHSHLVRLENDLTIAAAVSESQSPPRLEIKERADEIVAEALACLPHAKGRPIARLLASCVCSVFTSASTSKLVAFVGACNELIRKGQRKSTAGDPTPSSSCPAAECAGLVFQRLGRQSIVVAPETIQIAMKTFKLSSSGDSFKVSLIYCFTCTIEGLGDALSTKDLKDIFKIVRIAALSPNLLVRCQAILCIRAMIRRCFSYVVVHEFDAVFNTFTKSLEGSNDIVRSAASCGIADLFLKSQDDDTFRAKDAAKTKRFSSQDLLILFAETFRKSNSNLLDVRIGMFEMLVALFQAMGAQWSEKHASSLLNILFDMLEDRKLTPNLKDGLIMKKGESGRLTASKVLTRELSKRIKTLDKSIQIDTSPKESSLYVVSCCLDSIADLVTILGPTCSSLFDSIIQTILASSAHFHISVRCSAARCLSCLGVALPGRLASIVKECMNRLQELRSSIAATHGSALALAAVLSCSSACPHGLPSNIPVKIFRTAKELVSALDFNDGQATSYTCRSGWLLINSIIAMGGSVVRPHLKDHANLWKTCVPKEKEDVKKKEIKSRNAAGWEAFLQQQLGGASAILRFLECCTDLINSQAYVLIVRVMTNIIAGFSNVPTSGSKSSTLLTKTFTRLRSKVFEVLLKIPTELFKELHPDLMRYLVADFTLTDVSFSCATTSKLCDICEDNQPGFLSNVRDPDQQLIEQLFDESSIGSIEHEEYSVIDPIHMNHETPTPQLLHAHEPLPSSVSLIDAATQLFGSIFPYLTSNKHRLQLISHFVSCIKASKAGHRRVAIYKNILMAFLSALDAIIDSKSGSMGNEKVISAARELVADALISPDPIIRCTASEVMGRICQIVGKKFATSIIQYCFQHIQSEREVESRTGHSLVIGCIHKRDSGLASGSNLANSIGILNALSKDTNPIVQVWALQALTYTINAAGLNFNSYSRECSHLMAELLISIPSEESMVFQCIAKVINALISTLGPELQMDEKMSSLIYNLCVEFKYQPDPCVNMAAIEAFQQMIMFAPNKIDVPEFLPYLRSTLNSPYFNLRRAGASILKQLAQRHAALIHNASENIESKLMKMLDDEVDLQMQEDLRTSLETILMATASEHPSYWLHLCNDVLSGAAEKVAGKLQEGETDGEFDEDEEGGQLRTQSDQTGKMKGLVSTRWQSKVFAVVLVDNVISTCSQDSERASIHLTATVEGKKVDDNLANHLGELVRTAFMAGTSDVNELRQAGLRLLNNVISVFSKSQDPEMPGHFLLEQFQAQVTSALRPAFGDTTSPIVKATACDVLSGWIGSGISRDPIFVKRMGKILLTLLDTMDQPPDAAYNEAITTMLRLAVLSAWAKLYCIQPDNSNENHLTPLISPVLSNLREKWENVMKDCALLDLSVDYGEQIKGRGCFFSDSTRQGVKAFYDNCFPSIIHACCKDFAKSCQEKDKERDTKRDEITKGTNTFYLYFGLCVRTLCFRIDSSTAISCLQSLAAIIAVRENVVKKPKVCAELCAVLHKILRTHPPSVQKFVFEVVKNMTLVGDKKITDDSEIVIPGQSSAFSILEICCSALLREIPTLNPSEPLSNHNKELPIEVTEVVASSIDVLGVLPSLCEPKCCTQILPSVLVLLLGILKKGHSELSNRALKALRETVTSPTITDNENTDCWEKVVISSVDHALEELFAIDLSEASCISAAESLVMAVAVFMASVNCCAMSRDLQKQLGKIWNRILLPGIDSNLQLKSLQSIFTFIYLPDKNMAASFIRNLVPLVVTFLFESGKNTPATDGDVLVRGECIKILEKVCEVAPASSNGKVVAMVIPLMVSCLTENNVNVGKQYFAKDRGGVSSPFYGTYGKRTSIKSQIDKCPVSSAAAAATTTAAKSKSKQRARGLQILALHTTQKLENYKSDDKLLIKVDGAQFDSFSHIDIWLGPQRYLRNVLGHENEIAAIINKLRLKLPLAEFLFKLSLTQTLYTFSSSKFSPLTRIFDAFTAGSCILNDIPLTCGNQSPDTWKLMNFLKSLPVMFMSTQ